MARATIVETLACENPRCKHTLLIEVVHTVGKTPAYVEQALHNAAITLGFARVHAPGTTPRILCGSCKGRVVCRGCDVERRPDPNGGDFLCSNPSFDVDRVIEEGVADADL